MNKTPLYGAHVSMGGKMIDFAGWALPLHYGSQIDEHLAVRREAGVFDVSHMLITDVDGVDAKAFLRNLLANDVEKRPFPGQALYTCALNEQGGVVDDLIVYTLGGNRFRLVTNASTRVRVLEHLDRQQAKYRLRITTRADLALLAVQGPKARAWFLSLPDALIGTIRKACEALAPFYGVAAGDIFVARTGYTGEDGFEVMLPGERALPFHEALCRAGVRPAGLGARDTLRLEAGLNLYGKDMDESVTPLAAGLGWTLAWEPAERAFMGRAALERCRRAGVAQKRVGLVLVGKGVLRDLQPVFGARDQVGIITSGGFSPSLGRGIALARLSIEATRETSPPLSVEIRGRRRPVRIVPLPFVRKTRP